MSLKSFININFLCKKNTLKYERLPHKIPKYAFPISNPKTCKIKNI